jgi:hypothetical protein
VVPAAAATASARRWLAPAGAVTALALIAGAAVLLRPRSAPLEPAPAPSAPVASEETPAPAPSALPAPKAISPDVFLGPAGAWEAAPSVAPAIVEAPAAPSAPPPSTAAAAAAQPRERDASGAGEVASVTSATAAARTRMRFNVEHPFENGRLIVWIDGVLAFEEKLRAPVSKKIVAIKVREGRIEKLVDVEPGPHEVRVEVTWDQERRVATKVADAAPGSTGLLEVRVGRMSKDLTLRWSRLAKE